MFKPGDYAILYEFDFGISKVIIRSKLTSSCYNEGYQVAACFSFSEGLNGIVFFTSTDQKYLYPVTAKWLWKIFRRDEKRKHHV